LAKKYKVTIDPRDECISDMACVSLCPDVYEMSDEDGKAQIVEKYRTGSVGEGVIPEELGECAKSGAEACPVQIIHVEEIEE